MLFKFWSSVIKELQLLSRDRVGLALLFMMPIALAVLITSIQISAFDLVNNNKIKVLVINHDEGLKSQEFIKALTDVGRFELMNYKAEKSQLTNSMKTHDAFTAIEFPKGYSSYIVEKSQQASDQALLQFGLLEKVEEKKLSPVSIKIYYHPVLQESFRKSIKGGIMSVSAMIDNKTMLDQLYTSINGSPMPETFKKFMMANVTTIDEEVVLNNGVKQIPNATQHNIPAWTLFAMFFMVIALGGNIVKEKLNGSFIRLRTMPTSFMLALFSKQFVYVGVALIQVIVIFAIGVFLFPLIGLPALNIPENMMGLILVSIVSGWCAVSYALCIGVFAKTQEQASGFGAISVVLLAAIGGVLVPSFAMPAAFQLVMKISPLHWSLEAFYAVFLENNNLSQLSTNLVPLLLSIVIMQTLVYLGLKNKSLI